MGTALAEAAAAIISRSMAYDMLEETERMGLYTFHGPNFLLELTTIVLVIETHQNEIKMCKISVKLNIVVLLILVY